MRDDIVQGLFDAVVVGQLAVGHVDLTGSSDDGMSPFDQSQSFMSFTRGHLMINAKCTGPVFEGSSKPRTSLVRDEDARWPEVPDPGLLQCLDVGVGCLLRNPAGCHVLGANINNAEYCILPVSGLEVEDVGLDGLIETSLLRH